MTSSCGMKAWIDGAIVDAREARVSVLDHGYLYGDGVFEGIRIAHRRIFRLDDHLRRLELSARAIDLELPWDRQGLAQIVSATARALDRDEAYVRLVVSRGEGALGVDPTSCRQPRLVCIVGAIALYSQARRAEGLSLVTSSLRRPPFDVLDPRVKSLNYLNNVLAKMEAKRQGADDALLLNLAGRVCEASVANVFLVEDGGLATPPTSEGALAGITRKSVLEAAQDEGIPVKEVALTRADLLGADEVFLSGSGAGIVSVSKLDGRAIGHRQNKALTTRITAAMDRMHLELGTPF